MQGRSDFFCRKDVLNCFNKINSIFFMIILFYLILALQIHRQARRNRREMFVKIHIYGYAHVSYYEYILCMIRDA